MGFLVFLLFHVLARFVPFPELLMVETDDGVVHGISPSEGTSVWSILTGPPLIESFSSIDTTEILITKSGSIYFIDRLESASHKLSLDVFEIVNKGPLRLEEAPGVILFGNKLTKIFKVNAISGEYLKEDFEENECPTDTSPYQSNLAFGRTDYQIFAVNQLTNQMMWNATFSKFTSFADVQPENHQELLSVHVYENDRLVVQNGEKGAWSKTFSNSIIGMHGFNQGYHILSTVDVNYTYLLEQNPGKSHYSELVLIGCLLLVAMSVGFYFGKRFVKKKPIGNELVTLQELRVRTPVHSRNNSEVETNKALSLVNKPCEVTILDLMKTQNLEEGACCLNKIFEPVCEIKDLGREKLAKAEFELSVVRNQNEIIHTETHKVVKTYQVENEDNDSSMIFKIEGERAQNQNNFTFNNYPVGEFSQVIAILDNGNYAKKFFFEKILGQGGFSEVHLARHKLDDQLYAIKIVRIEIAEKETLTSHKLFAEVNAIKTLQSKYVVRYITCWVEFENENSHRAILTESSLESSEDMLSSERSSVALGNHMPVLLHIQMEYCPGTTLKDWLDNQDRVISRAQNYKFFFQMVKGIQHIHERGIIHRDLKPANIFIDGEDTIKIGDFNLATFLFTGTYSGSFIKYQRRTSNIGTPLYLSPEQTTTQYNNKVDIFPLGIILLELCFKYDTYHELLKCIKNVRDNRELPGELIKNYPIEAKIIMELTASNPEERPDASEILKSQLMASWKSEVAEL